MTKNIFETTSHQKVLGFLASFPDKAYFSSEVSRSASISLGAANRALRELSRAGFLTKEKKGKMNFYTVDLKNPIIRQFKVIQNIVALEETIQKLKRVSQKIVLFGSAASGTNLEGSDIDLFVLANDPKKVLGIINKTKLAEKVQVITKKPIDIPSLKKKDPIFYEEVEKGLIFWEK